MPAKHLLKKTIHILEAGIAFVILFFLGLLPITALVIIDLINNKLAKKTIHIILFPVALFTFIYIFSKLQWSVECCLSLTSGY